MSKRQIVNNCSLNMFVKQRGKRSGRFGSQKLNVHLAVGQRIHIVKDQNLGVSVTDVADANQEISQHTATENGKETHDANSVITVVRDPHHTLGKTFALITPINEPKESGRHHGEF